jgi:hypothetical protein
VLAGRRCLRRFVASGSSGAFEEIFPEEHDSWKDAGVVWEEQPMCCYGKPWLRKAGRAVFVLVFAFGQTSEGVEPFFLDTPDAVWALNVVFSGDGTYLAANVTMPSKAEGERGSKEQLWIWDFATRTKVGVLQDPPAFEKLGIEQSIAFCPQAKRIAAARYAGRVVVWEALDSWSHTSFRELTGPVYSGDKPEKLRYTTGGSHAIVPKVGWHGKCSGASGV